MSDEQLELLTRERPEAFRRRPPVVSTETVSLDSWPPGSRPSRARRSDPDSSHRAADEGEQSGRIARRLAAALEAVRRFPGATSAELAELAAAPDGLDVGSWRVELRRRLPELRDRGLVKRTRLGKADRRWWLAEAAVPDFVGEVEP